MNYKMKTDKPQANQETQKTQKTTLERLKHQSREAENKEIYFGETTK